MPHFQRDRPSVNRTFALRSFNSYETEINEHFWSFKVISEYAGFIARTAKRDNPNQAAAEAFHASGPDARRIPPTVSNWLDAQVELENWLRLSALVSAAAFHEAYLRQVVRSALMAAPLVRYGTPRLLDGTTLLKSNVEFAYSDEVMAVTRGDWQARAAAFQRLFGAPIALFPLADLEEIRKIRNDYAHGFGRDLDIPDPSSHLSERAYRLNQTRFVALIGIMSRCARDIDRFLLDHVIGDFEFVHAYHKWHITAGIGLVNPPEIIRRFQAHCHGVLGVSRSRTYCKDIFEFYQSI